VLVAFLHRRQEGKRCKVSEKGCGERTGLKNWKKRERRPGARNLTRSNGKKIPEKKEIPMRTERGKGQGGR